MENKKIDEVSKKGEKKKVLKDRVEGEEVKG